MLVLDNNSSKEKQLKIIDLVRFIVLNRGNKVFKDWTLGRIVKECAESSPLYYHKDGEIYGCCFFYICPAERVIFVRELLVIKPGSLIEFVDFAKRTFPGYIITAKRGDTVVDYGTRFTKSQEFETCLKFAKDIVNGIKEQYPYCEYARNGGDPKPQSGFGATGEAIGGLSAFYPWLSQAITGQILPQEQAIANAAKTVAPTYGQTQADLYSQFGPSLNYISGLINRQNALQDQATQQQLLGQGGQDVVNKTLALQKQIDPGYFSVRDTLAGKTNDLLNSINPTALSGSERAEVERSLNQQNQQNGLLNAPSSLSTVNNAMTFGKALQDKQGRLSQAINSATATLQPLQSGYNASNLATGRLGAPSVGNGLIPQINVPQNTGQNSFNLGSALLGQSNQNQQLSNQINSQRRDNLDRFNQTLGSVGSLMPSSIS